MSEDDSLPLKKLATNLVFGEGSANSDIVFIGEGPGYWEDQKARPFVGNAGKLLDQLLEHADLERKEVFITNVVHYRPPENRDPLPEELKAFGKYLDKIIQIIKPRIIVTLGRFSMAKFVPNVTISQVHGKARRINWNDLDIIVVPMYHPAAGLRNGDIKRKLYDDFYKFKNMLNNQDMQKMEKKEEIKQMNLV
jgi:DNA polymerase